VLNCKGNTYERTVFCSESTDKHRARLNVTSVHACVCACVWVGRIRQLTVVDEFGRFVDVFELQSRPSVATAARHRVNIKRLQRCWLEFEL
jgi:hypothetical protein